MHARLSARFLAKVLLSLSTTGPLQADIDGQQIVRAEIITGWRTPDGRRIEALELRLAPGWKTYWRAPGDAGIAPVFDWIRSQNIESVDIVWPTPIVFYENGIRSIGYAGEVILPLYLSVRSPDRPVRLRASISMGVCSNICIPYDLEIDTILGLATRQRDPRILYALDRVPLSAREAGVGSVTCTITPNQRGMRFNAQIQMPSTGNPEAAIIEAGDRRIWVSEPKIRRNGDVLTLESDMERSDAKAFSVDRSAIRITVLGSGSAVDIKGCQAR